MTDVPGNIARVRERIGSAAARAGRRPDDVILVAVTKGVDVERIRSALAAGVVDLGENRVQEAVPKIEAIGRAARWHMIGHLQRNKAHHAATLFDVIHSLDSAPLAVALGGRRPPRRLDVLLQVNVTREPGKHGVHPETVADLARQVEAVPGLRAVGLMTIAPLSPDPERARPVFTRLRQLRDELGRVLGRPLLHLSMGMSDDFEVAVEEGATMVRIGRAIFGPRG